MRVLALLLALLLLAMPVAIAQQNNTTENQTTENQTAEQDGGTNDSDNAESGPDDGSNNVTLPDRSGHIPWAGLAVGLIIFAASVVVSRVTYHGRD